MASVSRRAFLGRAAGASGIALTTPWWVEWVGKFFGPSGHIHDTKVRTYIGIDYEYSAGYERWKDRLQGWDAEHRMLTAEEVEEQTRERKRRFAESRDEPTLDQMMVARSNGRVDLPFTNFRHMGIVDRSRPVVELKVQGIDPKTLALWNNPNSHHISGLPKGVYIQKIL